MEKAKHNTDAFEKMPIEIYATPRGTGCISGVWVDFPIGDESRGEHRYVLASEAHTNAEAGEVIGECLRALESIEGAWIDSDSLAVILAAIAKAQSWQKRRMV